MIVLVTHEFFDHIRINVIDCHINESCMVDSITVRILFEDVNDNQLQVKTETINVSSSIKTQILTCQSLTERA